MAITRHTMTDEQRKSVALEYLKAFDNKGVTSNGGSILDLSRVLSSGIRPSDLIVVDIGDLTSAECRPSSVVCVGVDTTALGRAIDSLLGANLELGDLLDIDIGLLRSQIDDLLAVGDLGSLLSVVPVGDGLFQLVPQGPLAELAGLADVPNVVIGALRLA